MKKLKCELCGGTDLIKKADTYVCQNCGTEYPIEELQKTAKVQKIDVSGSVVKIDTNPDVANLLTSAYRYLKHKDFWEAAETFEEVYRKDATNWEAAFFSVYCTASDITSVNKLNKNNILVFGLISKLPIEEQKNAISIITKYTLQLSEVYYKQLKQSQEISQDSYNFMEDEKNQFFSDTDIGEKLIYIQALLFDLSDLIEDVGETNKIAVTDYNLSLLKAGVSYTDKVMTLVSSEKLKNKVMASVQQYIKKIKNIDSSYISPIEEQQRREEEQKKQEEKQRKEEEQRNKEEQLNSTINFLEHVNPNWRFILYAIGGTWSQIVLIKALFSEKNINSSNLAFSIFLIVITVLAQLIFDAILDSNRKLYFKLTGKKYIEKKNKTDLYIRCIKPIIDRKIISSIVFVVLFLIGSYLTSLTRFSSEKSFYNSGKLQEIYKYKDGELIERKKYAEDTKELIEQEKYLEGTSVFFVQYVDGKIYEERKKISDKNSTFIKRYHLDTGKLNFEVEEDAGEYKGIQKIYDKDGILIQENDFGYEDSDGVPKITYYYPNGNVKSFGMVESLQTDEPIFTGLWKYYNMNNTLEKEIIWNKGKAIITKTYTDDGQIDTSESNAKLIDLSENLDNHKISKENVFVVKDEGWPYQKTVLYKNGDTKAIIPYLEGGVVHGVVKYYSEGNGITPLKEIPYEYGMINGIEKEFFTDGTLKRERNYEHNVLEGELVEYYQNGNVRARMPFHNNELDGVVTLYSERGKANSEVTYKNGKKKSVKLVGG